MHGRGELPAVEMSSLKRIGKAKRALSAELNITATRGHVHWSNARPDDHAGAETRLRGAASGSPFDVRRYT